MPLSVRKQSFVDEYLVDLSATGAAIRAGYSPRGAAQAGHRLLQEPAIKDALAAAVAERSRRTHVTADRVVRELARVAFADIRDIMEWDAGGVRLRPSATLTDDAAIAIAEVKEATQGRQRTLSVKLGDRLGALRLLAAHTGVGADAAPEDAQDTAERIRRALAAMEATVGSDASADTAVDPA